MVQHIIIGNFGNHSLAVTQALIEKNLRDLHFIYVETGWAAACWAERVAACTDYARRQGVNVCHLQSQLSFSEIVKDRKQFPSPKFQWCASFLKGLTILNHLEHCDPDCDALIVSGKSQSDSRRYANLQEFDYEDDYYQGRTLWYPLWQTSKDECLALVKRAGFHYLSQQSLECSPCIHSKAEELSQIDQPALSRLEVLEEELGQTMYASPIRSYCGASKFGKQLEEGKKPGLQQFD